MRRTLRTGILTLAIGLVVGLGIGAATGWWVWPVRFTDAEISDLRPADQDAFLVLAGEAFAQNGDVPAAEAAVAQLAPSNPGEVLLAAADRLDAAGRAGDAEMVRRLSQALTSR